MQSLNVGEIDQIWSRIETWLQANAPEGLDVLRKGASAEAIRAAEERLDLQFPDALRQSLARHDGQQWGWPSLIDLGILMPLQQIVDYTRSDEQHGVDEAAAGEAWWRKGWLPFVSRDGDHLSVALGASGDGEVWAFQHDLDPIYSASLRTLKRGLRVGPMNSKQGSSNSTAGPAEDSFPETARPRGSGPNSAAPRPMWAV